MLHSICILAVWWNGRVMACVSKPRNRGTAWDLWIRRSDQSNRSPKQDDWSNTILGTFEVFMGIPICGGNDISFKISDQCVIRTPPPLRSTLLGSVISAGCTREITRAREETNHFPADMTKTRTSQNCSETRALQTRQTRSPPVVYRFTADKVYSHLRSLSSEVISIS